ncbi:hypothetical protein GCM10027605_16730 [Micromonospora zhanjiangensis]
MVTQRTDPVRRVLVVDDDRTVSDVVCRYLEHAGYAVSHAGDGAAALAAVDRDRPDLVVLDLMLPEVDGLEVCRRLRGRVGSPPIIMLTALGDEADRIAGLSLGADDYVSKPFSPGNSCCGWGRCCAVPVPSRRGSGRRRSSTATWWWTWPAGWSGCAAPNSPSPCASSTC